MAIINCPECGKKMSSRAVICLSCGFSSGEVTREQLDVIQLRRLREKNIPGQYDQLRGNDRVYRRIWLVLVGIRGIPVPFITRSIYCDGRGRNGLSRCQDSAIWLSPKEKGLA